MNTNNSLKAITPLDGRYANKLKELNDITSEYGLIKYRVKVEILWFLELAACPDIAELPSLSNSAIDYAQNIINNFDGQAALTIKELEATTNHDVKAVEYYIKQKFLENPELKPHIEFVHFCCTSEDINNLAYALMLQDLKYQVILPNQTQIADALNITIRNHATTSMLARTHGQTASPTTLGKEIAVLQYRLLRQVEQLSTLNILAKINGAVGNFNAHIVAYPEVDWEQFSINFISKLGLNTNPLTTQIEPHDNLAEFCHIIIRANNVLLDLAKDIWSYISIGYFNQKAIATETGSSTMPHKVNPIDFENAEGNLGLANALLNHFANKLTQSRWQRDLSDSTVLRNIGSAIGYCLIAYKSLLKGLDKLSVNKSKLEQDLKNSPEVLAEAIQTIMRKFKIDNSYEKLKAFTRDKKITLELMREFINNLPIDSVQKSYLLQLTPDNYIGLAEQLCRHSDNL